jgi:hypothetical protein
VKITTKLIGSIEQQYILFVAASLAPVWGDTAASLEIPSKLGIFSLRCVVATGLAR